MGDDSVIECVAEGNTISAYTSWTRRGPFGITREDVVGFCVKIPFIR